MTRPEQDAPPAARRDSTGAVLDAGSLLGPALGWPSTSSLRDTWCSVQPDIFEQAKSSLLHTHSGDTASRRPSSGSVEPSECSSEEVISQGSSRWL